jgi:hypothetical protein
MKATLVLPTAIADDLMNAARLPAETAGVLIASIVPAEIGNLRLLAREMHWIPEHAYLKRDEYELLIKSEGYVPFLARAERLGGVAIWVHTHTGADGCPLPSEHDHVVDEKIADLFRLRCGTEYYCAAIFSQSANGLSFSGSVRNGQGEEIKLERLWIVGDRLRMTRSFDARPNGAAEIFDRNILAFGPAIQEALGELTVGVVGCGGTGSAITEQLVRLGVRKFVFVDPDNLSESNLTRVYGSSPGDVGRAKVDVLRDHVLHIAPDASCMVVKSMVTEQHAARALVSCDVIFGCTDDNAGRLVLSRMASYMLTPVIDCGVLLSSDNTNILSGIDGRVTVLTPGHACLVCRGRIDLRRAASELLTPEERTRLENEGYAPALGRTEPAVVGYTTLVAATAVTELLERFIGYGPQPTPGEILLRYHEREISTNVAAPKTGHYCDPASGKLGMGVTSPFLEQTWAA